MSGKNMLAYLKDAFRTIKLNGKRLVAIATMVVLGVGLFVGIPMACDNAYLSACDFYNGVGMFDVRIVSTLGLTDDDVLAISSVAQVESVFACFSKNVRTNIGEKDIKVSVTVMDDEGMNTPYLLEGALPLAGKEIAVSRGYLRAAGKNIGDTLQLTERSKDTEPEDDVEEDTDSGFDISLDEEKTDNLVYEEYLITAAVLSPMDTSAAFNDNTGGSAYLFYINKSGVSSEVYTEVYATVSGASRLNCYGAAYSDLIKGVIDEIDASIKEERLLARYTDVKAEALVKIDDAQLKFTEKKAEADEELRDGEEKLKDAREKIRDGEEEIADALKKITDNRKKLYDAEKDIAEGEAELADALKELEKGREEYEAGLAQYNAEIAKLNSLQQGVTAIPGMVSLLSGMLPEPSDIQAFNYTAAGVVQSADGAAALLAMGDEQSKYAASGIKALTSGASSALAAGQWQGAVEALSQLAYFQYAMEAAAQAARQQAGAQGAVLVTARILLEEGFAAYHEGALKLAEGRAELKDGWRQLNEARVKLEDAGRELEDAKIELADGEREFEENFEEYRINVADAQQRIDDAKTDIENLAYPKWYILGRSSVDSFERLKNDVSSIRAVGSAFPVIFLIVAISVCLTSMTRLVEEERSVVGTYMALG
ncbi:MAG: hypothetical protein FWE66_04300, partial [Oscillospiraceae bacterium]|nr:hypothetical protein [Oscillospiraceae bacterium]